MTDNELRVAIENYKDAEVDYLLSEEIEEIDHEFSPRFNKKMQRLFWSEKYFGKRIRVGYAVRRAAAIVIIIGSLFAVDEVSAAMTGIHPWKYIWSHISGINMDEKIYTEPGTQEEGRVSRFLLPQYVPEGYEEVYVDKEDTDYIGADWEKGEALIRYDRIRIKEGLVDINDAEFSSEREIIIHGYRAVLRTNQNEIRIDWIDEIYSYSIYMGGDNSEDELIKMADSLYWEKDDA